MCGISGFVGPRFTTSQLEKAADSLSHRGPDASGIFREDEVGLAHKRLSILELSELGAQPYYFKQLVLSYNGEIYNYRELRAILQIKGYEFISDSDTEVLIKAFHFWGERCLNYCCGMFAFAIYDREKRSMFLCRDRMGIKPLYYSLTDGLSFGSELKALLHFDRSKEPDPNAIREYFRFGYISAPRSIYQSVKKLEAGSYLIYQDGKSRLKKYWEASAVSISGRAPVYWKEELHKLMVQAFSSHMIADVPVGVFLSGGIDSSLLCAVLSKHYGEINTFTIGFKESKFNEAPFAKAVSEKLGTRHTEVILDSQNAISLVDSFYSVYDEPFADSSGIPTVLISQIAGEAGMKVVLSADGGDELFGGYNRYQEALRLYKALKKFPLGFSTGKLLKTLASNGLVHSIYSGNAEHRLSKLSELISSKDLLHFYQSFLANQSAHELDSLIDADIRNEISYPISCSKSDLSNMMLWDLKYYLADDLLVKMDRATMFTSIEGREPFLDHRLVEFAFKMPAELKIKGSVNKWILRELLADYIPREVFERPKQGFSIPLFDWFKTEMDGMFRYYLDPDRLKGVHVLNSKEVLREYRKYTYYKERGKSYNMEKMWRILSFLMWWEKCYEGLN